MGSAAFLTADSLVGGTSIARNISNGVSRGSSVSIKRGETNPANARGESSATLASQVKAPTSLEENENPDLVGDLYRYGGFGRQRGTQDSQYLPPRFFKFHPEDAIESIASIRLYSANELVKKDGNQKGKRKILNTPFTKFFLQSVGRARQERMQIFETFTTSWIFFFGEQTPIYTMSGTLLKGKNHNWLNDFLDQYERAFRGTRAVERDATIQINVLDNILEGYIFNINLNQNAINHLGVPFSFNMVILKEHIGGLSDENIAVDREAAAAQALIAGDSRPKVSTSDLVIDQAKSALKLDGSPTKDIPFGQLPFGDIG